MSGGLLEAVVAAARRAASERERRWESPGGRGALPGTRRRRVSFEAALREPGVRVIAECKRRSPSRGILRDAYDPVGIARGYASAGAAAISILTEPTFFDGSIDDLRAVRAAVGVAILRKDFIVTPYQIDEAAAAGADAVLLIVAALEDQALLALMARARHQKVAALVEVHDRPELDRALAAGATLVGVNSRNLRTLAMDPSVFETLAPHIPAGVIAVAESGLQSGAHLARLKAVRYDAFLIGERFMAAADPGAALTALLAEAVEATR